jgi:hypothetical protein
LQGDWIINFDTMQQTSTVTNTVRLVRRFILTRQSEHDRDLRADLCSAFNLCQHFFIHWCITKDSHNDFRAVKFWLNIEW